MSEIDVEKLKAAVTTIKQQSPGQGKVEPVQEAEDAPAGKNRQHQIQEVAASFLTKTGLDSRQIQQVVGRKEQERERATEERRAAVAAGAAANEARFQQQLEGKREALAGLLNHPFTHSYTYLETPFLIWETPNPQLNILQDSQAVQFHSNVRVKVDYTSGSDYTNFVFYYLWENTAEVPATINVFSSLLFNGNCLVSAAGGAFSGDACNLNISATLDIYEWWNQPPTTPLPQSTQYVDVVNLSASGPTLPEYLWNNADSHSQALYYQNVNLSYSLLRVPPLSEIVVEVGARFSFGFTSGGLNLSDLIEADFATEDLNYRIQNPLVIIDVLEGTQSVVGSS